MRFATVPLAFITPICLAHFAGASIPLALGDVKPAVPASSASSARAAAGIAARAPFHDTSRVIFDEPGDGAIWARGRTYKASFGREGASVIPSLGAEAPANHPLRMRPAVLSRGGAAVAFDFQSSAARNGDAITFDRGSFVERYDLGPDAIEQSFVFQRLPGQGDLVLHLAVETDLAADEDAGGLRFENDLGGLHVTRAKVLDAMGRSQALATHVDADGIEIVVPESFLATARYPLTIDPVITTFAVDVSATNDFLPDVAYDPGLARYMISYEEAFSATDHDVYVVLLDFGGTQVSATYVDFTTVDWRHPRIANAASAQQFMVAAHTGVAPARSIQSRTISGVTIALGSQVVVNAGGGGFDQADPDIGGDPAPTAPTEYLIVWEFIVNSSGERDIVQMLMHTDGTPDGFVPVCIDCGSTIRDFSPSVSKSAGQGPGLDHTRTVVWEYQYSATDHDIYGAQLALAFQTHGPFLIDGSTADDRRPNVSSFADLSSSPDQYLVTFDRVSGSHHDIVGALRNTAGSLDEENLSFMEGAAFYTQDQIEPCVDSDGYAFAVSYSELYSTSATDYDVYVSTFAPVANAIEALDVHQNLAFTSIPELDSAITSTRGSGPLRYMSTWTLNTPGNGDIYAGLYESAGYVSFCVPGTGLVQTCPCGNPTLNGGGCNNSAGTGGALLGAAGAASVGFDTLTLTQTGERPNSLSIVLQGTQDNIYGAVFADGVRCVDGTLKRLYLHTASAGTVSAPVGADISVSARSAAMGDPIAPGSTRFYQIYYRDPILTFCAPGANVGNGLKVLWLP